VAIRAAACRALREVGGAIGGAASLMARKGRPASGFWLDNHWHSKGIYLASYGILAIAFRKLRHRGRRRTVG